MACADKTRKKRCAPPCCPCDAGVVQTKIISASKGKCGRSTYTPTNKLFLTESRTRNISGEFGGTTDQSWTVDPRTCEETEEFSGPGEFGGVSVEGTITETSFSYSETFDPSEGEDPGASWTVTSSGSLSDEYTDELLESQVEELLDVCDFEELEWGESQRGEFDDEGEAEAVDGSPFSGATRQRVYAFFHLAALQYRIRVEVADYCPQDGALLLKWREKFVPIIAEGDEEDERVTEYTDKEEEVIPEWDEDAETFYAYSSATTIPPPDSDGTVTIVGPQIRASLQSMQVDVRGMRNEKQGFLEYAEPSDPPKVYLREIAEGNFAGCPLQDLPPKEYTGGQELTEGCEGFPASGYEKTASEDAEPYLSPFLRSASSFAPPEPSRATKTQCVWEKFIQCGEDEIEDRLTMSLEDEFTTARLKEVVDDRVGEDWDSGPMECAEDGAPAGRCAIHYLDSREMVYWRTKIRARVTALLPAAFAEERDFTFKIRKITTDLETGTESNSDITIPLTFEAGQTLKIAEWQEVASPSLGNKVCVYIVAEDQPEDVSFSAPAPMACWTNEPRTL